VNRDIVVIGTSAGGVAAMKELSAGVSLDLPASLFLTIHTSPGGPHMLAEILNGAGRFYAIYALDHEPIRQQCTYIAAPDRHLILKPDHVVCFYGPKENKYCPSIDVMFRSASETFGPRVVGVVLTGYLDDGSEGLLTIRERGGVAIVRDPAEAEHADMPLNALRYAGTDYVRPLADIPGLLMDLAREKGVDVPPLEHGGRRMEYPTTLTCPECGGVLNQDRDGKLSHFRCQVGHAFSLRTLDETQAARTEANLWASMQALEERSEIARRMADEAGARGDQKEATEHQKTADESLRRAKSLREMLEKST
jgi:two-component system chemotaxis response regulator CheB